LTTEHHPLAAVVIRHAERLPASLALSDPHDTLTYESLARLVERDAARFNARGFGDGSKVAIRVSNRVGDVVRLISLAATGARVMLLDEKSPAGEAQSQIRSVPGMAPLLDGAHSDRHGTNSARAPSFYLTTSGTNGRPKVVERDWTATINNATSFATAAEYSASDIVICATPLHHCYAFGVALLAGLVAGAEVVLPALPVTPSGLQAVLNDRQATVVQGVPFLYRWWCGSLTIPDSLRLAITAGEPASAALQSAWRDATGRELCDHYGTTETGALTLNSKGVEGSVGRPIAGVDIRVSPVDGGDDGIGEIHVRTVGPSARYCAQPALTRDVFRRRWFATGDLGRIATDGHLQLLGRRSSRVNVAGRKVDPLEVERAIASFPGITECAVVGVPSERSGEEVQAFVVGDARQHARLRTFLTQRLSTYKIPSAIEYVNELPRSSSGKVLRRALTGQAGQAKNL
jgi:acyl-CoA synthetase (AMP-forming)/AMP-acid ligase II